MNRFAVIENVHKMTVFRPQFHLGYFIEFDFCCTLSIAPMCCVPPSLTHSKQVSVVCIFSQEMTACLWVYGRACVSFSLKCHSFSDSVAVSLCAVCVSAPRSALCIWSDKSAVSTHVGYQAPQRSVSLSFSLSADVLSTYSAGTVYLYLHFHTHTQKTHKLFLYTTF